MSCVHTIAYCVTVSFHQKFSLLAQFTPKNSKKVCRYFRGGLQDQVRKATLDCQWGTDAQIHEKSENTSIFIENLNTLQQL